MSYRFLVRPKPYERESLASHIVRLSKMNGYDHPFDSRRIWADCCPEDNFALPLCENTAVVYCFMTNIEMPVFVGMTAHRFAAGMLPPGEVVLQKLSSPAGPQNAVLSLSLEKGQLTRHLRAEQHAAYCPLCLRAAVYHRIDWQPRIVTMCREHGCCLRDACPECGRFVGIADVTWGCCRTCGARLAAADVEVLDDESSVYRSQCALQGWLHRDGTEDGLGISTNEITEPLNALYYVVLGLSGALRGDMSCLTALGFDLGKDVLPRLDHRVSDPKVHGLTLAAAYEALLDWPRNFYHLLDVVRTRQRKDKVDNLTAFGSLYSRQLSHDWQLAPFMFVQNAFDQYMMNDPSLCASLLKSKRSRGLTGLADRLPYMSLEAAAKLLGIGAARLGELMQQGVLRRYNNSSSIVVMVKRSEVEALRESWRELLMPMEVSIRLGIYYDPIIALAENGLLEGRKGIGPGNGQNWGFTASSVDSLVEKVAARVEVRDGKQTGSAVDLVQAVQRTSAYGMNTAQMLKAIIDGELGTFVISTDWRLGDLLFEERVLDRFIEMLLARLGWVTREDFARRMGVKRSMITKWVANGLLVRTAATAQSRFFDGDYVDRFVADHVFSEEAAVLLAIPECTVRYWATHGRLHPVSGPGVDDCHRFLFNRADLYPLRLENRLNTEAAASLYGVTFKVLTAWIKQGKVKPISGPSIDGTGKYLFLRDDLGTIR